MAKQRGGPRFIKSNRPAARPLPPSFEAEVKGLADTGNAVVESPGGQLFFVPGAWVGEQIQVRPTEIKSQYGLGTLTHLVKSHTERVEPPCPHHGNGANQCGGCPWMFMSYEAQLQAKQERVERALARLQAKLTVQSIQPSPQPLGYRLRAQLKTDGNVLGFVANGRHQLVPVDDCVILTEKNRQTLKALRQRLPKADWAPTGQSGRGAKKAKSQEKSAKHQEWTTLDLDETVSADTVSVNKRLPFQQANAEQNHFMRAWLARVLADVPRELPVLEFFAGSGNFTKILSEAGFQKTIAVEVVPDAVDALEQLSLAGVKAVKADLFDEQAIQQLMKTHKDVRTLVLDPPRDGLKCRADWLSLCNQLKDVFYISCDLATLCRDLQDFLAAGFVIVEAQPVDLFPQTPHVEMLVHLRRK